MFIEMDLRYALPRPTVLLSTCLPTDMIPRLVSFGEGLEYWPTVGFEIHHIGNDILSVMHS